jgi:hypothetical protein
MIKYFHLDTGGKIMREKFAMFASASYDAEAGGELCGCYTAAELQEWSASLHSEAVAAASSGTFLPEEEDFRLMPEATRAAVALAVADREALAEALRQEWEGA